MKNDRHRTVSTSDCKCTDRCIGYNCTVSYPIIHSTDSFILAFLFLNKENFFFNTKDTKIVIVNRLQHFQSLTFLFLIKKPIQSFVMQPRRNFLFVLLITLLLGTNINVVSAAKSARSAASTANINKSTATILASTAESIKSVDSKLSVNMGSDSSSAGTPAAAPGLPDSMKLLIGAGGIYGAFLYYGSLQEDVFRFVSSVDGTSFKQAWFLQVLEALANVVIGFIGMQITGPTKGIPLRMFGISGAAQVSAKACTSLALANGLSFPVATLAKSGKMAPVMAGSLLLGGATYTLREYLQVACIIGGTAVVSLGKKKGSGGDNSMLGVFYIVMSLVLDGVTAGFQKRLKTETAKVGVKPKPYDFMFWTNLFMCITAVVVAGVLGEINSGGAFLIANPEITSKIIKFCICSAVGQSFIFYTIANFDPLVLSTVTTTRKIFSVLLSIFLKGHSLSLVGWSGIGMAVSGILSELQAKASGNKPKSK